MLTDRLGHWCEDLAARPLPAEALRAARRALIDWYAATLPGSVVEPATVLRRALAEELGHGGARLLPDATPATMRAAALINGAAAHTVEFDDIFRWAVYHPGVAVIPAALAVAESARIAPLRFLTAIVAGYEVSTRIGAAVSPAHYEFWHTTGTVGSFGAAAAASVALGLDGARTGHALASVATMAAALQQAFRSDAMSKPMHAGRAAEAGVLCALGAREGLTGAREMLEGPRGFGRAMAGEVDWEAALADLGERWNIARMTVKNHGCCGHTFAALDALIALREAHGLRAEDVERIHVGSYQKAVEITGDAEPETAYQAKFSLPFCAATALVHGRVRLDAFTPERIADPVLRRLARKITVTVDDEAQAAFPGRRSARVEVLRTDGSRLSHHAPTRKGDPDAPLTDAELVDKFEELAFPVLGEARARRLLARLQTLETVSDMAALATGADPAARAAG
ncbi:MAG: MmgE/PrpD family protein [Ectothiorhodospiraceae bacterium]|nr:MmgE/PrpD family protein [Ectothiorhodospiraceae bacterium]